MPDHSDPSEAPDRSPVTDPTQGQPEGNDQSQDRGQDSAHQPREYEDRPRSSRPPQDRDRGDYSRSRGPEGGRDSRGPRRDSRPSYGGGRGDFRGSEGGSHRGDDRQDRRSAWPERGERPQSVPRTAREVAAHVLLQVFAGPVDDAAQAVHHAADHARLSDADRRLAFHLTHLVLRHAEFLDHLYYGYFNEPPDRLRFESRIILRLAVVQKYLLDRIPDHAIGDESVLVARDFFRLPRGEVSFINAIVRRILARVGNPPELEDLDRPVDRYGDRGVAPLAEAARRSSCPPWIVQILGECLGSKSWDELPRVINGEAPVVLRVNRLRSDRASLQAELTQAEILTRPGELVSDALVLEDAGDLSRLLQHPAFDSGKVYIQDEASQLVGLIAAPQPGERILDLCAAPGGKATHLAELAGGEAEVYATDYSDRRFELLEENVGRLGTTGLLPLPWSDVVERRLAEEATDEDSDGENPRAKRIVRDRALGTDHPAPDWEESQDLVLLDAPCSGLGTLRRHPEIRHRLKPDDLKRLSRNQQRLLRLASEYVRPGGRLVYSTCTIAPAENLRVVESFLATNRQWVVDGASENLPPAIRRLRHSDGFYRTWPTHLDLDGFEMVVLRRRTGPVPGAGLGDLPGR